MTKRCTKCGETKPLEAFTTSKRSKDGREPRCKPCRNEAERTRYRRRMQDPVKRERLRELKRRRREADPKANREKTRRWRRNNPERARQLAAKSRQRLLESNPDYFREWYWKHAENQRTRSRAVMAELRRARPELEREWGRRYRAKNLATVQARERENTHRRRALVTTTSPKLAQLMAELVTQPCAYCGSTERVGIDHVVPLSRGGGHEANNLVPACHSCNSSKSALLLDEWAGPPALRNAA